MLAGGAKRDPDKIMGQMNGRVNVARMINQGARGADNEASTPHQHRRFMNIDLSPAVFISISAVPMDSIRLSSRCVNFPRSVYEIHAQYITLQNLNIGGLNCSRCPCLSGLPAATACAAAVATVSLLPLSTSKPPLAYEEVEGETAGRAQSSVYSYTRAGYDGKPRRGSAAHLIESGEDYVYIPVSLIYQL
ncbi:hypothetical protein Trydic_g21877 [Trypoxylus dichotomus]